MNKFLPVAMLALTFLNVDFSAASAKSRTIEMTYRARIGAINADAKRVDLWIPYPLSDDDQKILDMKIDSPYPVTLYYDKEFGNGIIHLNPDPTRGAFQIKMTFVVERREVSKQKMPKNITLSAFEDSGQFYRFLTPSRYAVINDRVKFLAQKATAAKKGIAEKARGAYDFILGNMSYNKTIPGWGKGDVDRLCFNISDGREGTGNCTDFHSFFGSIMRATGIPVVFEMGFPLTPQKDLPEGKKGGYHCWAKFYLPGKGWVPVDISEADKAPAVKDYYFGSIDENRVRFSRGRDILLEPHQKGDRLNYFGPDPYLEIDGVASENFERWISYKDI